MGYVNVTAGNHYQGRNEFGTEWPSAQSLFWPKGQPHAMTVVLGIESSCDESAAAIVERTGAGERRILSNLVLSQLDEHRPYGGVVPEIAARAHIEHLDSLVDEAMAEAGKTFSDLDGIAATAGPGLIGGVIVGLMTGKGIALTHNKPFLAVNHLEGHALTARLTEPDLAFPYLLLLISGGHCQLLHVKGVGQYDLLGTTMDDAVGEAFDKTAKLLGLGYPGGPAVEAVAKKGDAKRFVFPHPLKGRPGCDFSFSGLKTAVRQTYESIDTPTGQDISDIAASFQATVAAVLEDRCANAMTAFKANEPQGPHRFVVAGGVAANQALREIFAQLCEDHGFELSVPPAPLCTDNAAMIAWAGVERLEKGWTDGLDVMPKARWPLAGLSDSQ